MTGIEALGEYLAGRSRAALATAVGRSESWVSRLLAGQVREVSVQEAAAIERWSDGAVPASSWLPRPEGA